MKSLKKEKDDLIEYKLIC